MMVAASAETTRQRRNHGVACGDSEPTRRSDTVVGWEFLGMGEHSWQSQEILPQNEWTQDYRLPNTLKKDPNFSPDALPASPPNLEMISTADRPTLPDFRSAASALLNCG